MNNLENKYSYHQAYLKIYGGYNKKNKDKNLKILNYKKFNFGKIIITSLFVFIPVLFTFVIEFSTVVEKKDISKSFLMDYEKYIIKNNNLTEKSEKSITLSDYKDQLIDDKKNKNIEIEISQKVISNNNNKDKIEIDINNIYFSSNLSEKKIKFIKMILPFAISQNQSILAERERLLKINDHLNFNKTIDKNESKFIKLLAKKYKVEYEKKHKVDIINELLLVVDIIPNSIVLAQAANESGWGSSRFAKQYNALFGEYTYNNELGVVPDKREEGKKHLIKYFSSYDQSVISYFNNINSHYAYDQFRKLRKMQRNKNVAFDVFTLVEKLDFYAEDKDYVNTISSIIRTNGLQNYDNVLPTTNL